MDSLEYARKFPVAIADILLHIQVYSTTGHRGDALFRLV